MTGSLLSTLGSTKREVNLDTDALTLKQLTEEFKRRIRCPFLSNKSGLGLGSIKLKIHTYISSFVSA